METVILGAGLSERMGGSQKLLMNYHGLPLVCSVLWNALRVGRTVLVTGHQSIDVTIAAEQLGEGLLPNELLIVKNKNYLSGQFSSALVGIAEVTEGENFFVSLGDLPLLTSSHYHELEGHLGANDALRVYVNGKPGHPVLFRADMKHRIEEAAPNFESMNELLESGLFKVGRYESRDEAFIRDVDTPADWKKL